MANKDSMMVYGGTAKNDGGRRSNQLYEGFQAKLTREASVFAKQHQHIVLFKEPTCDGATVQEVKEPDGAMIKEMKEP